MCSPGLLSGSRQSRRYLFSGISDVKRDSPESCLQLHVHYWLQSEAIVDTEQMMHEGSGTPNEHQLIFEIHSNYG